MMKDKFLQYIQQLQDTICAGLEKADGNAKFREDLWERLKAVADERESLKTIQVLAFSKKVA